MAQGLDSLVKLSDVVKETLWFTERPSSDYRKAYQHAINGYRELAKHHLADCVRTAKLTMDSNYIASFPDDMLQWIKVSISKDGVKWPLTQKRDLINTTSTVYGVETRDEDKGEGEKIYVGGYGFNAGIENQYGYFIPDYENRRFIFLTDERRTVYLDYSSIGISSDADLIPVITKDALQAYIVWKLAFYDAKVPMNDKMLKKEIYDEEILKLESMYSFNLDTLRDVLNDVATGLPTR